MAPLVAGWWWRCLVRVRRGGVVQAGNLQCWMTAARDRLIRTCRRLKAERCSDSRMAPCRLAAWWEDGWRFLARLLRVVLRFRLELTLSECFVVANLLG